MSERERERSEGMIQLANYYKNSVNVFDKFIIYTVREYACTEFNNFTLAFMLNVSFCSLWSRIRSHQFGQCILSWI